MQKERPNARRGGGNSYIEHSQAAEEKRQTLQAFLINLFLAVVLPPVGVLLAWHSKHLNALMRVILSVCALGVMIGAFALMSGASSTNGMLPTPQTPVLAGYGNAAQTPEPVADFYAGDGQEGYTVTYGDGTTEGTTTQDGELPMDPTTQVTIVYAVTNNAQYYHKQEICDMQTNSRRLILQDAIAEGLQPCSKCYPDGAPSLDAPQSVPAGGDVIIPDDALAATDSAAEPTADPNAEGAVG